MENFFNKENNIELLKWFISSVVIVLTTLIVESKFKDRETGLEEMKIYNQYVEIILKADNIEERWRLAEYFSIVTPTERLRERWIDYKNILDDDYKKYKNLKDQETFILLDTENLKVDSLVLVQKEQRELGGSLINDDKLITAEKYEKLAFESLLDKNVNSAIHNFKMSENSYSGYHQVYEIYLYLLRNSSKLQDEKSEYWNTVFSDISNKYSWKMPKSFKNKFKNYPIVTDEPQ